MSEISFYIKAFVTLLVLVNPLEGMPVFLAGTEGVDPSVRKKIEIRTPIAVTVILILSLFLGNALLKLFGISIGAFQIGGGIILFLISVQMILGAGGSSFKMESGEIRPEFAIVPLAMPLFAGPGAINGAVLYGTRTHSIVDMGILAGVMVGIGLAIHITLKAATPIARYIKSTGINITTRIMGLIIAAISIEMIAHGVAALFKLEVF